MSIRWFFAASLALAPVYALAQTPAAPQMGNIDPRLSAPMTTALQGVIQLREAQIAVLQQDMAAQAKEAADKLKALDDYWRAWTGVKEASAAPEPPHSVKK